MNLIPEAAYQCMKKCTKNSTKTYLHFHPFYFHSFDHEIYPDRGTLTRWEQTLDPLKLG